MFHVPEEPLPRILVYFSFRHVAQKSDSFLDRRASHRLGDSRGRLAAEKSGTDVRWREVPAVDDIGKRISCRNEHRIGQFSRSDVESASDDSWEDV